MSVKVAIRVRPFNQREKFLGCICCVDMKENTTILYENKEKNKKQHYFTFDYSLWSHDQFAVREDGYMMPSSKKYVDQLKVYNIIGKEILENAWQGYNCCLFAYGQTGAGKSYSMIGYGINRGIIPMVCEEIFLKIKKHERKGEKQYQVALSMLQIYNQKVQDLFTPTSKRPQNGLKVRQNKALGVYVEGLTKHEVFSYTDIQRRMDQGSKNRSLASTLMNEYSSRAHTIIMIEFVQKEWINKLKMNKKSSFINLVDLAGSERVAKTGIQDNKDRLKEASNINKSLHTLGRVIETLAEQAAGKGKILQVPYRDSALTRILQTALGGNSKTIMICAISPANDNYQQTLSTLRYADQTKKIKNKPIINESAVDKIIRELREQNQRLKKMLETSEENSLANSRDIVTEVEKKEIRSNLRASMRQVQKEIKKNLKSFAINTDEAPQEDEESLMMTEFIDLEEPSQFFSQLSFDLGNKAQVYITNLNEDELLNYKVRYSCEKDILITNKNNKKALKGYEDIAKIVLCGLGIEQNHAKITKKGDKYFIQALSETSSEYTLLNGKPVYEKRELQHNDRIIMGINSVFVFKNNLKKTEGKQDKFDYQFAMNERQTEMENTSLISPTSLNLFLSSNSLLKGNQSRQMYSPPNKALNSTRKLFEQENQKEILDKLTQIERQFNNLVKENEQKMKEKEQFYRGKLSQLKHEKEKQKEEKSNLQEKLMIKSIESESLKTKNVELQKLKQKLSKYNDQKDRRKKFRESLLIESEDNRNNVIEEDIIGEFIDVEDPKMYKSKPTIQFEVATLKNSKNKNEIGVGDADTLAKTRQFLGRTPLKPQRTSYAYEEVNVEEFQNADDIRFQTRQRAGSNLSNESLLITDEELLEKEKTKFNFKKQARKQQVINARIEEINKQQIIRESQRRRARMFQFRRIYNIKILCEQQVDLICPSCSKIIEMNSTEANPSDDSFIAKYLPNEDASLEEFHYKNNDKKKVISRDEMLMLEQQILELQSKLNTKALQDEKSIDEMLLNYSMDKSYFNQRESYNPYNPKMSFGRKGSDSYDKDFQLNLTIDHPNFKIKSEYKTAVNEFINILAEIPYLEIQKQKSHTIYPMYKRKTNLGRQSFINFKYQPIEKILTFEYPEDLNIHAQYERQRQMQIQIQAPIDLPDQSMLINEIAEIQNQHHEPIVEIVNRQYLEIGINTELYEEESSHAKGKLSSFTTFLNEQFEMSNQNHTELSKENEQRDIIQKEFAEIAINTEQIIETQTKIEVIQEIVNIEEKLEVIEAKQQKILVETQMVTDINMSTFCDAEEDQTPQTEQQPEQKQACLQQNQQDILQNYVNQNKQNQPEQVFIAQNEDEQALEQYLNEKKEIVDVSMNTSQIQPVEKKDYQTNTHRNFYKDAQINTTEVQFKEEDAQTVEIAVNTSDMAPPLEEKSKDLGEDEIQKYLQQKSENDQIQGYLEKVAQQEEIENYIQTDQQQQIEEEVNIPQINIQQEFKKLSQIQIANKINSMVITSQVDLAFYEQIAKPQEPQVEDTSPINQLYQAQQNSKNIQQFKISKLDLVGQIINFCINLEAEIKQVQQIKESAQEKIEDEQEMIDRIIESRVGDKPEMIDAEIQIDEKQLRRRRSVNDSGEDLKKQQDIESSNQYERIKKRKNSSDQVDSKLKNSGNNSQQFAKEFNLSVSDIEKHDLSYQDMSAMNFDGLLKEDELNNRIKFLQQKIKDLEIQSQQKIQEPQPQIPPEVVHQNEEIKEILEQSRKQAIEQSPSKYVPIKRNKKKKKKNQMTEQQRKQLQIEKQIQAKIIQCNNENLINERNLQIHKRKRQAEQLRKILFKKEKVQLQKILLILIPMVRRFNLIAREMKRLIQAKISIQYRNFSHYEMIEVLKNHSVNKQNRGSNIQIKIVVLNCEEGRIYTWPSQVFKNRYEIAEQTFQKYLQNDEDSQLGKSRAFQDRNQRSKDPFWDPVDYIPQGVAYLSMQVLIYNLSYEGYISIVYRSIVIAKIYIAISPVKARKHNEDDSIEAQNDDESELDHIEIFNQRNLLEKDIYFTISVESIKFMKKEERQKLEQSNQNINLTSLNSNILKYTISYELLEDDYKLNTYSTPEIDFVEDKQFKRIDYLRRHSFKNISESTLAYISDCPIKFTLNVMKDYNEECLNASFNNEDYSESQRDPSEHNTSVHSGADDEKSVRSRKTSQASVSNVNLNSPSTAVAARSDFSKKPSIIYENTEIINKLDSDAKKQQEKRDKIKKLEESRTKNSKNQKGEKDKDCTIY